MAEQRRKHSAALKARVALAAVRGDATVVELASRAHATGGSTETWTSEAFYASSITGPLLGITR